MKFTKSFLVLILSVSVLSACNQNDNNGTKNGSSEIQTPVKKDVEKNDSVNLPVDIFVESNYKIEGQQVTFARSITNVEIRDFDESSEIEFLERYDNDVRRQGFDLQKDFKLLVVTMKQETKEEARSKPLEALMFNEGSGLVIGDVELASQNDFIMYQQEFLAIDYKVGKTLEGEGNALIAIPKEIANDPNLQLRINQKIDNENKYIYIDLK